MEDPTSRAARRTETAALARMVALAAVIGLVAGGAAWLLLHAIGGITNVALFGRGGWDLPSLRHLHRSPRVVVVAVAGAAVVTVLARWAPVIRGHGLPEAAEAVLVRESRIAPRTALAKPLSAAVAIGTGGPFGAEGPIIVTGGALGSMLGQALHVSPAQRKVLLASGAAAGMAATFGSPLAAVVLALELLLFEFSARVFLPLAVAAAVASGVHAELLGSGPLFDVPRHEFSGLGQLPVFAVVGLLAGLLATVVAGGLFLVEEGYRRLPVPAGWHPVIGAVAFSSVGLLVPRSLGVGYDVIDDALAGRMAAGTLAALALVKLVVWWLALASGTSGGTLAPILCVSSTAGALAGIGLEHVAPGSGISPSAVALVAMAATFGAATRAPFTAIVFLFELTRDYDAILPIMTAAVVADLVTRALLADGVMTEKLTRRGLRIPGVLGPDPLAVTGVAAAMTSEVVAVRADAGPDEVRALVTSSGHRAYPVVDADGRLVGVLDAATLVGRPLPASAAELAAPAGAVVHPAASVAVALERLVDARAEHLVVVEDDRVVGICTRSDILGVRALAGAAERRQPGWLARVRAT